MARERLGDKLMPVALMTRVTVLLDEYRRQHAKAP